MQRRPLLLPRGLRRNRPLRHRRSFFLLPLKPHPFSSLQLDSSSSAESPCPTNRRQKASPPFLLSSHGPSHSGVAVNTQRRHRQLLWVSAARGMRRIEPLLSRRPCGFRHWRPAAAAAVSLSGKQRCCKHSPRLSPRLRRHSILAGQPRRFRPKAKCLTSIFPLLSFFELWQ